MKDPDYLKNNYPDSKADLFAVFIERCGNYTRELCFQSMITQHAWMFLSSFEKLRNKLQHIDIVNMIHLGARAFDEISGEIVQTASFIMRKSHTKSYAGVYCRLLEATSEKGKESLFLSGKNRYCTHQDNFLKIPGAPLAYWAFEKTFDSFENEKLENAIEFRSGLSTIDNERFLRLWPEVNWSTTSVDSINSEVAKKSHNKWFAYNKGGGYRRWYGNRDYLINWYDDGMEIKQNVMRVYKMNSYTKKVCNEDKYFQEGMTWSTLGTGKISFRYTPIGSLFDVKGSTGFCERSQLLYNIALLNSCVLQYYMELLSPTIDYNVKSLNKIPLVRKRDPKIDELSKSSILLSKLDWDAFETSWDFKCNPLVKKALSRIHWNAEDVTVEECYHAWADDCANRFADLKANEEELNRIFTQTSHLVRPSKNVENTPKTELFTMSFSAS